MKRLLLAMLAVAVAVAFVPTASATMPMGKAAKEAGFADAGKCTYCHNESLPKKGAATNNDRGKFLVDTKAKKNAKEIDVTWLKEYKEPAK
jgi:cytochrome c553